MAVLQAHVPDVEKMNFDLNSRKINKNMTRVVNDFIAKFNREHEIVKKFLYPNLEI